MYQDSNKKRLEEMSHVRELLYAELDILANSNIKKYS